MDRSASFNEKLLLSNGLSVSPLKNGKSSRPDSMSLREIVHNVDTQRDLSEYLCANHSKVPPSRGEPKYERHPVSLTRPDPKARLGAKADSWKVLGGPSGGPTMSGAHPPTYQPARSQPPSQGTTQPSGHSRQDSFQPTSPVKQPAQEQQQMPPSQEPDWSRGGMPPMPAVPTQGTSSSNQHERSFSSASMLNQTGPTASQPQYSNRNSFGPGMLLSGSSNSRYNEKPGMPSQGPPQLGALPFQEPAPYPNPPPPFSADSGHVQQHAPGPMGPGPGRGSSPPRTVGSRPVFGVSLGRLYERDGLAVPMVVYQCIQAVDLFGLNVEGIYRLSGSLPQVNKMKSMFDTGKFKNVMAMCQHGLLT
jgi:hypothetical protein